MISLGLNSWALSAAEFTGTPDTNPDTGIGVDIMLALDVPDTGSYGNKFDGRTDADGVITAAFPNTGSDLQLSFRGYDVDFADEIEIFLNGNSQGFLAAGVSNGFAGYSIDIAAGDQIAGENRITFDQALNNTYKWGVTDLLLREAVPASTNDAPTGTVTITGTAGEGETLTASNDLDDADGLGPVSYQWQADNVGIPGATGNTLTLTQAEVGAVITVVASYTDAGGTAESVSSDPTLPVSNSNDAPTGTVAITGTAGEGETLTASNDLDDADGLGLISYQWRADNVGIPGATGNTLTLTQAEVGAAITVVASYTDGGGTVESVSSDPTAVVAADPDTGTGGGGGGGTGPMSLQDRFIAVNGGAPEYQHPGEAWLTKAQGRFEDVSGWYIANSRGTTISIGNGQIAFDDSSVGARTVRHTLAQPIPAGSVVRVWFRVLDAHGNNGISISVGSKMISTTTRAAGVWSATKPLSANATYIQVTNYYGAAEVTDVAVEVVEPATEKLDIIVLAGQSNMVGASSGPGIDHALDLPHPKVLAMSGLKANSYSAALGRIDFAHPQLQHRNLNNGGLGPGLSLARWYAENSLAAGRKLLIICAARGSTKLVGNAAPWNRDGTNPYLYDWAVTKAKAAVALNPGENRVVGVAWSQGESDYGSGNEALYPAAFSRLVDGFRSELSAPALPFVVLGLNPNAISANAVSMIAMQTSLAQGGANGIAGVVHSGWSPDWGDGTKTTPGSNEDTVHFSPDANRLRGVQAAIDLFG